MRTRRRSTTAAGSCSRKGVFRRRSPTTPAPSSWEAPGHETPRFGASSAGKQRNPCNTGSNTRVGEGNLHERSERKVLLLGGLDGRSSRAGGSGAGVSGADRELRSALVCLSDGCECGRIPDEREGSDPGDERGGGQHGVLRSADGGDGFCV